MIVTHEVVRYLERITPESTGVLGEMEEYGRERRFPLIGRQVGRFLSILARSIGARRVFECGSGYGYSAYWFARAVGAGGEVTLTDGSADNLAKAREFLGRAGFAERCLFREGDALSILAETEGPFDLILVDIDKESYPASLEVTVDKLRSGGLLVTDNVLWDGRVAEEAPEEESTRAIQEYTRRLYEHSHLETSILPLRDGVAISRKL